MCSSLPAGLLSAPVWAWLAQWRLAAWFTEISRRYYAWGSFNLQWMSWTNVSHTHLRKFLWLFSHSLGFLEGLLQRPRLTHATAGLSVFFGDGRHARQCHPLPPHTHTQTLAVWGQLLRMPTFPWVSRHRRWVPLFWEALHPVQSFCVRPAFPFLCSSTPEDEWANWKRLLRFKYLGLLQHRGSCMLNMTYEHSTRYYFGCLVILLKADWRPKVALLSQYWPIIKKTSLFLPLTFLLWAR